MPSPPPPPPPPPTRVPLVDGETSKGHPFPFRLEEPSRSVLRVLRLCLPIRRTALSSAHCQSERFVLFLLSVVVFAESSDLGSYSSQVARSRQKCPRTAEDVKVIPDYCLGPVENLKGTLSKVLCEVF